MARDRSQSGSVLIARCVTALLPTTRELLETRPIVTARERRIPRPWELEGIFAKWTAQTKEYVTTPRVLASVLMVNMATIALGGMQRRCTTIGRLNKLAKFKSILVFVLECF